VVVTLMGGFRSMLIVFMFSFGILFYLEGLTKTRLLPTLLLFTVLGCALLIPMASHLPIAMQRAISFLPLDVDPMAKDGARASTEWRINMWKHLLPQIPQYFFVGKGYAIDASDFSRKWTAVAPLTPEVWTWCPRFERQATHWFFAKFAFETASCPRQIRPPLSSRTVPRHPGWSIHNSVR